MFIKLITELQNTLKNRTEKRNKSLLSYLRMVNIKNRQNISKEEESLNIVLRVKHWGLSPKQDRNVYSQHPIECSTGNPKQSNKARKWNKKIYRLEKWKKKSVADDNISCLLKRKKKKYKD